MEAKDILAKVKLLFNELTSAPAPAAAAAPPAPPAPPAPASNEYELADGGKVMIDKLEVGGIVMIDGNPALPGDIELKDGTKITVADNGVIATLTLAAGDPATPPAPEMDMTAKFTAFETSATEKFTAYEAKFAAYETRFAANEQKFASYEAQLAQYKTMIEQLLQFGKLMVEKPAAPPDPAIRTGSAFHDESDKVKPSPILFN